MYRDSVPIQASGYRFHLVIFLGLIGVAAFLYGNNGITNFYDKYGKILGEIASPEDVKTVATAIKSELPTLYLMMFLKSLGGFLVTLSSGVTAPLVGGKIATNKDKEEKVDG